MKSLVLHLLVCFAVAACAARGVAQTPSNVGPNEQRFNAGTYKASHNSYDRDETLASQIDNWNCWCIELDLHWHPDNTIQILDRIISKEHAQIQRSGDGRFLLRDLRSLNGTFLRGERVGEHYLQDGEEVTMGSTRLLFVDKPSQQEPQHRVTIAPGLTESHIRQRIQAQTGDFIPEKQQLDEKVLRRDYERLRIGHELARAVGSELDLEKLLPKILDKAFELVGADRGAILLIDDRGEPVPRYVKTRSGKSDTNIVLSRTVLAEVVQNRAAVLSSDATMDSRFSGAHSIIMQGIRSTMTLPLLYGTELLGLMHLDSLFTSNAFTEKKKSFHSSRFTAASSCKRCLPASLRLG